MPAKVFSSVTLMLIALWAIGVAMPFGVFRDFMTKPITATVFSIPGGVKANVGQPASSMPEYTDDVDVPELSDG